MVRRCKEFYTKLYGNRRPQEQPFTDVHYKETGSLPPILPSEVRDAIKRLKPHKAPGEDNILLLASCRMGGEPIVKMFTKLSNGCIVDDKGPSSWKNASVSILHKKGDTAVISKIIDRSASCRRMLGTLEQHQTREQAGFRAGFSTTDHIQVVNQLQEKANEYKILLCFLDYKKAFDSIEFTPFLNALKNQGVDQAYITIL